MKQKNELITAIKKCRNMWLWLKEYPNKTKKDYFKNKKIKRILNDCFACDYALGIALNIDPEKGNYNICKYCFLLDIWHDSDTKLKSFYFTPCESLANSPYTKWRFFHALLKIPLFNNNMMLLKEKVFNANKIVEGCEVELKKLHSKKGK